MRAIAIISIVICSISFSSPVWAEGKGSNGKCSVPIVKANYPNDDRTGDLNGPRSNGGSSSSSSSSNSSYPPRDDSAQSYGTDSNGFPDPNTAW